MDTRTNGPAAGTGSPHWARHRAADAPRPSVAVIGAGVSGLTAAYLLSRTHDVTVHQAEGRLGGHAHTHDIRGRDGRRHAVGSGFIAHEVTYPADFTFKGPSRLLEPLLRPVFERLAKQAQTGMHTALSQLRPAGAGRA